MKINPRLLKCVAGVMAIAGLSAPVDASVTLPSSAALPTNSVSDPGFAVRTAQATIDTTVANSFLRALRQVNGILKDPNGIAVTNVAILGPETNGFYFMSQVSFDKDGFPVEPKDEAGNLVGTAFNADLFQGIPGLESDYNQFADESVALVVLEPGVYTLAICANAERTDANDDDGCSVFVGANPRDYFATKIADFNRTAGTAAFGGNQHIENQIEVVVPVRGAYPFRLLHWQQSRGANLQFYRVNTNTTERYLINEPVSDPTPLLAYRSSTAAAYNAPYTADITPPPGSAGNSAAEQLTAILFDGKIDGSIGVDLPSVQLLINGTAVVPQTKVKSGHKTTISYLPIGGWSTANNTVRLIYADSTTALHTNDWTFGVTTAGGSTTQVKGQWDFDNGDLRATVGNALTYFNPAYDNGGTGSNPRQTAFGTCSSLGVPLINGVDAKIIQVPGDTGAGSRNLGYVMTHGIAPNGGGTRVNQYTIIYDIMCTNNGGAASLIQITDPAVNVTDGDLFWQGANFGQGGSGYNGTGALTPNAWHRIVAAYDEAANPPVVTKYVDGIKQDDWTANQGLDNDRRALLPTAILFGDGDQDERRTFWVNSIQIRSGKMSDADIVQMGAPTGTGIPVVVPQSKVAGQWDFDRGDLSPTIGKALQYFNAFYDNGGALPTPGTNANQTAFGTCSFFGVPLINGVDEKIIQVPGDTGPGSRNLGYVMTHGIAPNGGGTRVNQYTIIFDIMCINNSGAASLIQITDPAVNVTDGDLFWQGANFGQGTSGYNGTGALTPNVWHRIAAAYNEAATPPVVTKYVDGIFQDSWTANQGLDNDRRALLPTAILFGDGDQDERRTFWVNSIQIRDGALSKSELAALGSPTPGGIPVAIPPYAPGVLGVRLDVVGRELYVTWSGGTLQSASAVTGPYTDVTPQPTSPWCVPQISARQFFRVRQ